MMQKNKMKKSQLSPNFSEQIGFDKILFSLIAFLVLLFIFACLELEPENEQEIKPAFHNEITFSRYKWFVKSSDSPVGPGPNYFSNSTENVWVDSSGQLHLRITNRNNKWYCAEVGTKESFGYGKYIFTLVSKVDNLNENIVLGLFTWSNDPAYHYREIDIEFGRWEDPVNDNAQFVVQPWDTPGNLYRFDVNNSGNPKSTSSFNWQSDYIAFQCIYGKYYSSFSYTGKDIPVPGDENVRINLWLVWGHPPSDSAEVEIVVEKFEFVF